MDSSEDKFIYVPRTAIRLSFRAGLIALLLVISSLVMLLLKKEDQNVFSSCLALAFFLMSVALFIISGAAIYENIKRRQDGVPVFIAISRSVQWREKSFKLSQAINFAYMFLGIFLFSVSVSFVKEIF